MKNAARSIFLAVVVLSAAVSCDEVNLLKIGSGGAKYVTGVYIDGYGPGLLQGINEEYRFMVNYNSGGPQDATELATWTSSAVSIANVSDVPGSKGQITPTGLGNVTISALYEGRTGIINLVVINHVCVGHPGYAGTRDGSPSRPFAAIGDGIASASAKGLSGVRVENGMYSEAVTIQPNISLYGGYNADFINRNVYGYGSQISSPTTSVTVSIMTGVTYATMIEGFTIHGGADTGSNTYGIMLATGGLTIVRNRIRGGNASGSNSSCGISIGSSFPTIIECNEIDGGSGDFAVGINSSNCPAVIRNNVIFGGAGVSSSRGIEFTGGGVAIRNNTVNGGSSSFAVGIFINGVGVTIQNNIIYSLSAGGYCCYSSATGHDPLVFQCNDLFGPVLYYNGASALIDIASVQGGIGAGTISGNVNSDVSSFFTGTDGFHLLATAPGEVKTGGLDGVTNAWGFDYDKDGQLRSGNAGTGWTMGAYEVN